MGSGPKRMLEPAVPASQAKTMCTAGDSRATLRVLYRNGAPVSDISGGDRRLQAPGTGLWVWNPFSDGE